MTDRHQQRAPETGRGTDGCRYRHEALFYSSPEGLLDETVAFVRDALEADEPVLVVLPGTKNARLGRALGADRHRVEFADMDEVGANPGRIIPAWLSFLDRHAARAGRVRGIGEPISCVHTGPELVECHRHEALLNVAFPDPDFWLLCPYDASTLTPDVLEAARRHHPFVRSGGASSASPGYPGDDTFRVPCDLPLPVPPVDARQLAFEVDDLSRLRGHVAMVASGAGLPADRVANLVLAVHEVATNSIRHGSADRVLLTWLDDDRVMCEVRDRGRVEDPLADRRPPAADAVTGRGLWMANQLCDLVQVRSSVEGTRVRVHQRTR